MEDLERQLQKFRLSRPPDWLKVRAVAAAQNAAARQQARRRFQKVLWAAIAAGLALAAVGHYVADVLAPVAPDRPSAVRASASAGYLLGPSELLSGDYRTAAMSLEALHKELAAENTPAAPDTAQKGK